MPIKAYTNVQSNLCSDHRKFIDYGELSEIRDSNNFNNLSGLVPYVLNALDQIAYTEEARDKALSNNGKEIMTWDFSFAAWGHVNAEQP